MLAPDAYSRIIYDNMKTCESYLEIGSYDGTGVVMLSKSFPDKKFYCIDPFIEDGNTRGGDHNKRGDLLTDVREAFLSNIEDCQNITHFDMTSSHFMRHSLYNHIDIDILFIDGDHSFETAFLDLNLAILFSKNKRLLVIMDDYYNSEVNKAFELFNKIQNIQFNLIKDYGVIHFYLPQ